MLRMVGVVTITMGSNDTAAIDQFYVNNPTQASTTFSPLFPLFYFSSRHAFDWEKDTTRAPSKFRGAWHGKRETVYSIVSLLSAPAILLRLQVSLDCPCTGPYSLSLHYDLQPRVLSWMRAILSCQGIIMISKWRFCTSIGRYIISCMRSQEDRERVTLSFHRGSTWSF